MYLSKLEIQGFKSFAEKTVLEFNKDMTAVVGPNGSGKSNVSDAVRWVLGEQSLKTLRGKKSQDVIFAGSDKKARLGFAEVNLYLNNHDGLAPIDYREIVITRRLYRDGESEYLINKNKVRLTDIQLLLAKASFGQRSYSIIGQGMIDSILTSSATERKELFDEATGVREYQLKKDQAILKLEHSRENLGQSEQLIKEIEPRLKSLTRQVKKLEKKEEIKNQLNELQAKYYTRLLDNLINKQTQFDHEKEILVKSKENIANEVNHLQNTIDRIQSADTEAEAWQKIQNDYQAIAKQKNQLLQELSLIKGKINLDLTKSGKLDTAWLNQKQDEIKNKLESLNENLPVLSAEIEKLEKQLQQKLERQNNILQEFKNLQTALAQAQQNLNQSDDFSSGQLKKEFQTIYQKYYQLVEDLNKVKDSNDLKKIQTKASELLAELKSIGGYMENNNEETGGKILYLQNQLNEFLLTKDSLVNEIQELKLELGIKKEKLKNLNQELEQLTAEEQKITAELRHAQTSGADNQELLKQQREIESKLSELETTVKKYKTKLDEFSEAQSKEKEEFINLQQDLKQKHLQLSQLISQLNNINIELAKLETKEDDLKQEIAVEFIGQFSPLANDFEINISSTETEILRLKNQLAIIGGIDQEVVDEYKEVEERYSFLSEQTKDLREAIQSCRLLIEDLDEKITKQFETAFKKINERFQEYFQLLFNGGKAVLILNKEEKIINNGNQQPDQEGVEESEENVKPNSADKIKQINYGIEIQATPPGKKLKSLNMLSGGEKALTSIALISAIIANNPSPFVILDEVDAALDEANSQRFAEIIDKLSNKTQFICITHNRATMEKAAILYGVTMGDDGISKLLSVNLAEADKMAGIAVA